MRKYYYIYKITCVCGSYKDKYYIGQHQTNDLNDNYAGSGTKLTNYYKKYGKEEGISYIKEILCFCKDWKEMQDKEDEYIGDAWFNNDQCLNIRKGGEQFLLPDYKYKEIGDKIRGTHWGHHTEEQRNIFQN